MQRPYDPWRDVMMRGRYPRDGKTVEEFYFLPHPARFLDENNDQGRITWDTVEHQYRPGKLRQFQQNIEANQQYFTHDMVKSALTLRNRHQGEDFVIIGSGPSIQYRMAEAANTSGYIIGLNRITKTIQADYIPWTERMASFQEHAGTPRLGVITAPFCSPTSFLPATENVPVYVYNLGARGGVGDMARAAWKREPGLLNGTSYHDSFHLALAMAYWMGAKLVTIYGVDYCWYGPENYYFEPSRYPDPELIWQRHIESGTDGADDKDTLIWQHTPVKIKDKSGLDIFTTPDMMSRAFKGNAFIAAYSDCGMDVCIPSDRGLLTGVAAY